MKAIILVVAIIAVLSASALAQDYSFDGNATIPDPDGTLTFRDTVMVINPDAKFAGFRSARVEVSHGEVDVDTLGGFISYKSIPFGILLYWGADVTWTPSTFTATACDNIMAKAYYHLVEKDASGTEVARYGMGGAENVNWNTRYNVEGDLKYFHMGTDVHNNLTDTTFHIGITFFLSAKTGRIDLGHTDIDPRMLESVVRISNYTYADPANHLSLKIAAVHGSGSFSASGDSVSTGEHLKQLYVKLADKCHVVQNDTSLSGVVHPVVVGEWVISNAAKAIIALSDAAAYLIQKLNNQWEVRIATVDFPVGARHIVYDPTLGAGSSKAAGPSSSASSVLPSALLALVALVAALLF